MRELEERILHEGSVRPGEILLVDGFINQCIDVDLMEKMGQVWKNYFADQKITKVMTVEASGIAIAALAAKELGVTAVFAKKTETQKIHDDRYQAQVYSYTKQKEYTIAVSKRLIKPDDVVLLVDDFLANGCAMLGLCEIVEGAGAKVAGIGIAIEKNFQKGGAMLRDKGYDVCSLARIDKLSPEEIVFGKADA